MANSCSETTINVREDETDGANHLYIKYDYEFVTIRVDCHKTRPGFHF